MTFMDPSESMSKKHIMPDNLEKLLDSMRVDGDWSLASTESEQRDDL